MTTVNLEVVEFKFDVNFPTIDCEVELEIPKAIPKEGGKKFKLKKFSLSLDNPKVTIPIDVELFGGSLTVELNTSRCEIDVSGEVMLDVIVKKYHWKIGPAHISYMTPLRLVEPIWSSNPVIYDPATLQAKLSAASSKNSGTNSGTSVHNDSATQTLLKTLFTFCGAGTLIDDMIGSAGRLANAAPSAALNAETPRTAQASSSGTQHGNWVVGFGVGGTGGAAIGGTAGSGFFFTSDGDYGYYGTAGAGLGVIEELGVSATCFVYWPDAGQSGADCFKGFNWFITFDGGEGVSGSLTISWPCTSHDLIMTSRACGIGVGVGLGGGLPMNFLVGNSDTWVAMNPPPFAPDVEP